jgi:cytochrome c oxidase subunit 1
MLPFFYNVYKSRKAPLVGVDDPWGWGRSLEWATSSPPPRHNFLQLPRIRSESPAFDLHHPELAMAEYPANGTGRDNLLDAGEHQGRAGHLKELSQGGTGTDVDGEGKA